MIVLAVVGMIFNIGVVMVLVVVSSIILIWC